MRHGVRGAGDEGQPAEEQEGDVVVGAMAATKRRSRVLNAGRVGALAVCTAAQALECRRPARTSPELERMVAAFRTRVPFIDNDTVMYPHIEASVQFLRER